VSRSRTLGKVKKIFFLKKKEKKKIKNKNFAECPDPGHSAKGKNVFLTADAPYLLDIYQKITLSRNK